MMSSTKTLYVCRKSKKTYKSKHGYRNFIKMRAINQYDNLVKSYIMDYFSQITSLDELSILIHECYPMVVRVLNGRNWIFTKTNVTIPANHIHIHHNNKTYNISREWLDQLPRNTTKDLIPCWGIIIEVGQSNTNSYFSDVMDYMPFMDVSMGVGNTYVECFIRKEYNVAIAVMAKMKS